MEGVEVSLGAGWYALELLLELHVTAAAEPAHVPAHLRRIPVLIRVARVGLADDLERTELATRNCDQLDADDPERIALPLRAALLFVETLIVPSRLAPTR